MASRTFGKEFEESTQWIIPTVEDAVKKAMLNVAPKVLYDAASRRKFNSYTGAMAYAYAAIITVGGKVVGFKTMKGDELNGVTPPPSTLRQTRTGRNFSYIQGRPKHGSSLYSQTRTYKRRHVRGRKSLTYKYKKKRFVKPEEMNAVKGSYPYALRAAASDTIKGKGGKWTQRNNIQIVNASPYAPIVQFTTHPNRKRYEVLGNAYIRGRGNWARKLMKIVTQEELDKALKNYKKDYRSIKRGSGNFFEQSAFYTRRSSDDNDFS